MASGTKSELAMIDLMKLKNFMFDHGLERLAGGIDNRPLENGLSVISTPLFNIYAFKTASKSLWEEGTRGW